MTLDIAVLHADCTPEQCKFAYPDTTCEEYVDAMQTADDAIGDY
jgi:hypothetical protein